MNEREVLINGKMTVQNPIAFNPKSIITHRCGNEVFFADFIQCRFFLISHHYIDLDAEIICDICKNELDELFMAIKEALLRVS